MITKTIEQPEPTSGGYPPETAQRLRERAGEYFPEFAGHVVSDRLLNILNRNNSRLYRIELSAGVERRNVFVKVPTARGGSRGTDRPYLIPETDLTKKFRFHSGTLIAAHEHFERLNDPRFGTVRVLDLLPDSDAFVMEEVDGKMVRDLLNQQSRLKVSSARVDLRAVAQNIGGWLREFHSIPKMDGVDEIHQRPEDFVESIYKFTNFLAGVTGKPQLMKDFAAKTSAVARATLPERMPLGLRFGDYGLTNILVGADGRVTGIDTLGRWRAPIYEDLAWFLTGLKAYNIQIFSQGLAFSPKLINELEQLFLAGYFSDQPIPRVQVTLYEILRLLERWSSKLSRNRRRTGVAHRLSDVLANRFFLKKTSQLINGLPS